LTGGIGAGKSTVSTLLAEYGAVIVDADQIARDLQLPGSPVLDRMADRFGDEIIRDDGSLDRGAVAGIVFGDSDEAKSALTDLNSIVHPAMQDEIARQIAAHDATDTIVVLDFPLLGENPRDDIAATIVVDVPHDVAVERLVEFRGMDENDARNRIASQVSRDERLATATHVVDNSGDLDQLRNEVAGLWDQLTALRDRTDD
jgi:dephospho-CoA kinase